MKIQMCVNCDEPTGRCEDDTLRGPHPDNDGDTIGPLCEACFDKSQRPDTPSLMICKEKDREPMTDRQFFVAIWLFILCVFAPLYGLIIFLLICYARAVFAM